MATSAREDAEKQNVSDDTILHHATIIAESEEALNSAQGRHRKAIQNAKNAGVDTDMLKRVRQEKRTDIEDVMKRHEVYIRYARIFNPAVGEQLSLFESDLPKASEETKQEAAKFNAKIQGVEAGRKGSPRESNPYEKGTLAYQAFDIGWLEGEETRKAIAEAGPQPPRRPRGRPRKTAATEAPAPVSETGNEAEVAAALPPPEAAPEEQPQAA